MKEYNSKEIESKWQSNWEKNEIFKSENTSEKENY